MANSQFNSTTHGCCAIELLVLPNESKEAFLTLERSWLSRYRPQDEVETDLIKRVIAAAWLDHRSIQAYAQAEAELYAAEPNPSKWTDDQHKNLARFARYKTANQNAFKKAVKMLDDAIASRAKMTLQNQRIEQENTRLEHAKSKHEIFKRNNMTYHEALAWQHEQGKKLRLEREQQSK